MIFDFRCPDGHITEDVVHKDTDNIPCECGKIATRIISGTSFSLPGNDDGFPTAHEKWAREHERAGQR